ncbi:sugar phosphate isomerase/epimerase family protein [Paenibacillus allorhizosphaerae]|uniref:Xylose isomerase-like TIM barrel domain-containing protein n=1 Tax=Paenibacillus allorhizosphaerae TaxID=2849866 RepID=A0ABN7TF03_9BACL|nr:sugar phosphate isomerase/epimerase family protein [Paenibacillus allorhizosphaerae]CAG7629928.1 hypothetical protein PAECIP111802_01602 [Paenibacillus allorhizosphaerae]
MNRLVASPCCNPDMELEEVLSHYSSIGFRQFEIFTGWVRSAFETRLAPSRYLDISRRFGVRYYSFHLPAVTGLSNESLQDAVRAAQFAAKLGVKVVLFKAKSQELYIRTAKAFLDATEHLPVTPVLQNHAGSAISTIEDYREVIEGIGDDRMKTLLEVGHFHTAGVSWRQGCELLGDSIALVHIKDQIGGQSVPFGKGEIDLTGLLEHMHHAGYSGAYVIEMEVKDKENTLTYLADAFQYINRIQEALPNGRN